MRAPRSKMSMHNAAVNGALDQEAKPKHDKDGYIKEAYPLPPLLDYIDDEGTAEVILNCFKHYTRINQDAIGDPSVDLTCTKCIKGNGVR